MQTTLRSQAASTVEVDGDSIVIRIAKPQTADGVDADQAALLQFAARADSFQGFILWQRYAAAYQVWQAKVDVADAAGADGFSRVYDPLCQTAASYAVLTGSKQFTAERFVDRAIACMERVPELGKLMRDGVLTPLWFHAALAQTEAVLDDDLLAVIDNEAAGRLRGMGGLSKDRVAKTVNGIVAEHDADAARAATEAAKARKKVIATPVDAELSDVTITAASEDAALIMKSLDAVAAGVCDDDPRNKQSRRSDAAVARLTGTPFACRCGNDGCPARLSEDEIAERCAKIVLHVVARRDTLTGDSETPAFLDGFGPISAEHAREVSGRTDTVHRELDLGDLMDGTAQAGNNYRPTAACDTAVRALHGQCSMIGCDEPAWQCDLDHVQEYDHSDPEAGGPTCPCNLNPKCRFHHGLKTHVPGWVDDQIVDANGIVWTEVTTPEGITVRAQALNSWLLPELGLLPCTHPAPAGAATVRDAGPGPQREVTRTQAKHRYRMQIRAANRRARGAAAAEFACWGEPPF
ncbi:13E12 repeat family protein [Gordonia sp. HY285]|uniref:DUF222 domain-containing protein n=1 Tax=Gordonia liuliyuniae TaxID=2911517 RepID=UPI001F248576|nr:DUF222 domain-containing protein [Gordonia liuliyuniae]MCF8610756.1 13E12 repeat family protein [Gordonia liuliyuniae]